LIEILYPRSGYSVNSVEKFSGTVSTGTSGMTVWIVVRSGSSGKWMPQGPCVTDQQNWACDGVRIGDDPDAGRSFTIVAVVADGRSSNVLSRGRTIGLSDIPDGTVRSREILVIRR
jgi:hypothetical protein